MIKRKRFPDEEYDSEQLAMGIEVELEHTDDRVIAKTIASERTASFFYFIYLFWIKTLFIIKHSAF